MVKDEISIQARISQLNYKPARPPASVQLMHPEQSLDEAQAERTPGSYTPKQTAQSLRILIVATEAPPVRGGIARVVGYLQEGLQKHKHHVDVLAYPEVDRLTFGQIRLSSLIFRLPRLIRQIKEFDVIHVHGTTPTISDVMLLFLRIVRLRHPHPLVIYTHYADLDFGPGEISTKCIILCITG